MVTELGARFILTPPGLLYHQECCSTDAGAITFHPHHAPPGAMWFASDAELKIFLGTTLGKTCFHKTTLCLLSHGHTKSYETYSYHAFAYMPSRPLMAPASITIGCSFMFTKTHLTPILIHLQAAMSDV